MRSGIGYDVHRFGAGRKLVLGGVEIEGETGLVGHSDADVVAHAVMDALLGAAGRGDIGDHFPDVDAAFEGADSIELLGRVARELGGWRVANVDVTVIAERPRIAPHKREMTERMAAALGVDAGCVNVKATTNEGMGFVGRGEGIAALAVAQIERSA
ncbi:MAG TPA: 2-C-methyl-D-erythritol 2,4-cyclodiphosphate synthase [Solirubrobacterales bacterium]|nr:2-C-methyl-D-erythritol 2,4-cyclodiphosphate synthase [Solirubrobacterales bacterium]